jgi:hypothetical protein
LLSVDENGPSMDRISLSVDETYSSEDESHKSVIGIEESLHSMVY